VLVLVGAALLVGSVGVAAGAETGMSATATSTVSTTAQSCEAEITYRLEDTNGELITTGQSGFRFTNTVTGEVLGGAEADGGTYTTEASFTRGDEQLVEALINGESVGTARYQPCETSAVTVTVDADNIEALNIPMADFERSPKVASVDETITFTSTATDRNDDIESYTWDFGDETTGAGEKVTHSYSEPGVYRIFHEVTDSGGRTDSVDKRIRVEPDITCSKAVEVRFVNESGEPVEDSGEWWFDLGGREVPNRDVSGSTVSGTFDFSSGENTLIAEFNRKYTKTFEGCPPDEISITVDPDALPPDDREPNDDRDSASSIILSEPYRLNIIDGEDDWFVYDDSGIEDFDDLEILGILIGFDHSDGNIQAELYNENGRMIRSSYTDTDGESFKVEDPSDQRYYLRVYATDGASLEYRLAGTGRDTFDRPQSQVMGKYGSPLPERENDFPVMPVLAADRTQELRVEQAAWLVGSGTPETTTIRFEGAVEGNPTISPNVVENANWTELRGSYGQVVVGNVSITPTRTGEDVIRVVYEDGTGLKRVRSASSGEDQRADLTLDVAADPPDVSIDVLSTDGGTVRAQVIRGDTSEPLKHARVKLVDNGTVIQEATASTLVASLSIPADAGTNLSVVSVPPGFEQGTTQLDIDPGDIPESSSSSNGGQQSPEESSSTDDGTQESTDDGGSDGSGPGFGLTSALAGVGSLVYLLRRRLAGTE
jgi:hypothetical protein